MGDQSFIQDFFTRGEGKIAKEYLCPPSYKTLNICCIHLYIDVLLPSLVQCTCSYQISGGEDSYHKFLLSKYFRGCRKPRKKK